MNPSLRLRPALVDNIWTDHWVYWIGPIIGAAIAALLYEYVLLQPEAGPQPLAARPLTRYACCGDEARLTQSRTARQG